VSILFGILVGIALGLTGGGGSIFAVPLLIYGIGVPAKSAVAISLAAVAATAAMGAAEGLWHRVVELRAALIFAVAGMATAPLGVQLGELVSEMAVVVSFAGLMLVMAVHMAVAALKSSPETSEINANFAEQAKAEPGTVCHYADDGRLRLSAACGAALVVAGIIVGVLSGFFGVGGGFLIVPALMLITRMGIHRTVATSLLVITLIGISGVISAVFSGREIDWLVTGLFIIGGVGGMFVGRGLARFLAGATLQLVFAVTMIGTAIFLLFERLPISSLL
jgi:uncharacterized membrane protein YfcA